MTPTSPTYNTFFRELLSAMSMASDATTKDWEVDVYDFYPSRLLAQYPPYAQKLSQSPFAQHAEECEYDVIEYDVADFLPPEDLARYSAWGREQAQFIRMPRPTYKRANFSAILDGEWDLEDAIMKQQSNTEQQESEPKNALGLTGLSPASTIGSPSATFESSAPLTDSYTLGPTPAPECPHKANVEGLFRVARALLSHGLLLTPAEWVILRQWEKELDGVVASVTESEPPHAAVQSNEWIDQSRKHVAGLIDAMFEPVEEYWMIY